MMRPASAAFLICLAFAASAQAASSFQDVRDAYLQTDAVLLDRHHDVIHQRRVSQEGRRVEWVVLKDVSPAAQAGILRAEDRRFFEHHGVDWMAAGSALLGGLSGESVRGASTITMQLASFLNKDLQSRVPRRSPAQKWKQVLEAREIEKSWSKEQILEAYLNLVSFRGELQGLVSASRGLFGKEPHGLTQVESVILASLLRAPNASADKVANRACSLASALQWEMKCDQIVSKVQAALVGPHVLKPQESLAPHVALQLLKVSPGKAADAPPAVVSTLDGPLQRFAAEVLRRQLIAVRAQNVQDGAVLVVDNATGDVLAYVGSSGDLSSARYVDGVHAKRQAGSTLKPFLYGMAFDTRLLTPVSFIEDSPLEVPVPNGVYRPKNYDTQFQGAVTTRVALASSLNVPAVKTLGLIGLEPFVQKLRQVGFDGLEEAGDFYGPSLALGSADVSLWDLVNAYRSLANDGIWSEMRLTLSAGNAPSQRRVFSREAAFLVSHILSDREARSGAFGLESALASRYWSAVKTGTSKDMRDNWCIGYSSMFTVGVWVGNFSAEPMWNVSGITGAAPVWIEVMNWLHRNEASAPKVPPAGIVSKKIDLLPFRSPRVEWFIEGTEPNLIKPRIQEVRHRIIYPVSETVIAQDPDIPAEQQRLFFQAQPQNAKLKWMLDGEDVGSAGSLSMWTIRPGHHALSLLDERNRIVDAVKFEVRGINKK